MSRHWKPLPPTVTIEDQILAFLVAYPGQSLPSMDIKCKGELSDGQFYRLVKRMREDKVIHISGAGKSVLYFEGAKHDMPELVLPSPKLMREEKIANARVMDKLRQAVDVGSYWNKYLEVASESCA